MKRRQFLLQASQLALLSVLLPACTATSRPRWLVAASKNKAAEYFIAAIDRKGRLVSKVKLPERGHDAIAIPKKPGHALVFSRRPDRFALEVDLTNGRVVHEISSQPDTHFYGHGVLSVDGQFLYTSENLYGQKHGVIVVRETESYRVVKRFHSHGVGPHQLKLLGDGKTLVVANGGILTHPDWPRIKLNLDDMHSNLAYIDRNTGALLSLVEVPEQALSLRHLDVTEDDRVVVAAQYEGKQYEVKKTSIQALAFSHKQGEVLLPFSASSSQWKSMKHYTASILTVGGHAYVSCPRSNTVNIFDLKSNRLVRQNNLPDVAGLCALDGQVLASSGVGMLLNVSGSEASLLGQKADRDSLYFDNHMTTIDGV